MYGQQQDRQIFAPPDLEFQVTVQCYRIFCLKAVFHKTRVDDSV
jgi:hypothetical protein